MSWLRRLAAMVAGLLLASGGVTAADEGPVFRLYDSLTFFLDNAAGKDFELTVTVRDINHRAACPSEVLFKVYAPDGRALVREVIPDDGVVAPTFSPPAAGWDHEAWYYASCYGRGLEPAVRWSTFSTPTRLAATPKRTFTKPIAGGGPGVYRVVLAGIPDHWVTLATNPALPSGAAGSIDWTHGHHELWRRAFVYVPKGTTGVSAMLLQMDWPATRSMTVKAPNGETLLTLDGPDGYRAKARDFEPGQYDDQVLTVEVSPGPDDFLMSLTLHPPTLPRHWRGRPGVAAVFAPDEATAKALRGGAIYHDGQVFWQPFQTRYHDFLKTLTPADCAIPPGLPEAPGFISQGSHQSPKPNTADPLMHKYLAAPEPHLLNAALKDMFEGMMLIGPTDHVTLSPRRNLAYEGGCYSYFYIRPAWRILSQSPAPDAAKAAIREFVLTTGDRLAFARGMELVNGNSLSSMVAQMRYCQEASGDKLQAELFSTYFARFSSGGFGDRFGIGPSGGVQEGFGYDFHYGTYVLRGWRAVNADIKDPRLLKAYDGVLNFYSYVYTQGETGAPYGSRTHLRPAGGTYDPWGTHPWKGLGGPDLTESINGKNEFFAARRAGYYMVTYHGRITPSWLGDGFHGQIGYSGGTICQVHVPGKGQVLAGTLLGDYGGGMHPSQWRNFHIHTLAGMTADGRPLVTANSEHPDARLDGNMLTSSGEVRESSVQVQRRFEFEPGNILCAVKLAQSAGEPAYNLWGGKHGLRGEVTEAWELLPFAGNPAAKGAAKIPDPTSVTAVDAENMDLGDLTPEPKVAAAVIVDRGGYGVRIDLDRPRAVRLGNRTVMIEVVSQKTPAEDVALQYRIAPYAGLPPASATTGARIVAHGLVALTGVEKADQVGAALAQRRLHTVKLKDRVLGEFRLGKAGDRLAVAATIRDPKISPNAVAWKGSCVEIFGCMPGAKKIGQIQLVPAGGEQAAVAYAITDGKPVATDKITLVTTAVKGGYELQALIPFEFLALDAKQEKCTLELQVTIMTPAGKDKLAAVRGTLFGSGLAYVNSMQYGLFRQAAPTDDDPLIIETAPPAANPAPAPVAPPVRPAGEQPPADDVPEPKE